MNIFKFNQNYFVKENETSCLKIPIKMIKLAFLWEKNMLIPIQTNLIRQLIKHTINVHIKKTNKQKKTLFANKNKQSIFKGRKIS